ncbi:MAG: bifunctional pyr operon transcriptional regulator/uracil phosphoribosyltransferase PyrR [Ignavibacteriae bacterium]|nr:bifunctional pyr operon transcriptional regulator/uracil phosphoribosyltransferase PyrR [Ignavibacteriota bacterium]
MNNRTRLLDEKDFERILTRLAHEILERNKGAGNIALVGIRTRGEFLARRLNEKIKSLEGKEIPLGFLDITLYRDDLREKHQQPVLLGTYIKFDITGKHLILIDDVLFTGRTVRSALSELVDLGRPASIQLAVFIDRGHRELPIKADYVGKNIPTSLQQEVQVCMKELDGEDAVYLKELKENN